MWDGEGFERRKGARHLEVGEMVRVHLPARARNVNGYSYHGLPALVLEVNTEPHWDRQAYTYLCLVEDVQRSFSRQYLIADDDEEVAHET